MQLDPRMEALSSPDPLGELRSLARSLQIEGNSQPAILELFEGTRQQLRNANRDQDEDIIVEAMDFLVGWCSPHMSLER